MPETAALDQPELEKRLERLKSGDHSPACLALLYLEATNPGKDKQEHCREGNQHACRVRLAGQRPGNGERD